MATNYYQPPLPRRALSQGQASGYFYTIINKSKASIVFIKNQLEADAKFYLKPIVDEIWFDLLIARNALHDADPAFFDVYHRHLKEVFDATTELCGLWFFDSTIESWRNDLLGDWRFDCIELDGNTLFYRFESGNKIAWVIADSELQAKSVVGKDFTLKDIHDSKYDMSFSISRLQNEVVLNNQPLVEIQIFNTLKN